MFRHKWDDSQGKPDSQKSEWLRSKQSITPRQKFALIGFSIFIYLYVFIYLIIYLYVFIYLCVFIY